jgi:hypothetical protein
MSLEPASFGIKMKKQCVAAVAASLALTCVAVTPVRAGDGSGVAAGLLGGLAAGAIVGAAVSGPRYYYPPPPPEPIYMAPANCYWTRGQPVWDGYQGAWVYPGVRVCE